MIYTKYHYKCNLTSLSTPNIRRYPDARGYRCAMNAVINCVLQLVAVAMTTIEGVVFVTISEDVILMMADHEFIYNAIKHMLIASRGTRIDIPITFFVEEFDDSDDFDNISSKIEQELASKLIELCTLVNGKYFRADAFHEVTLDIDISFAFHISITDGTWSDKIYCAFDGHRSS